MRIHQFFFDQPFSAYINLQKLLQEWEGIRIFISLLGITLGVFENFLLSWSVVTW